MIKQKWKMSHVTRKPVFGFAAWGYTLKPAGSASETSYIESWNFEDSKYRYYTI